MLRRQGKGGTDNLCYFVDRSTNEHGGRSQGQDHANGGEPPIERHAQPDWDWQRHGVHERRGPRRQQQPQRSAGDTEDHPFGDESSE